MIGDLCHGSTKYEMDTVLYLYRGYDKTGLWTCSSYLDKAIGSIKSELEITKQEVLIPKELM